MNRTLAIVLMVLGLFSANASLANGWDVAAPSKSLQREVAKQRAEIKALRARLSEIEQGSSAYDLRASDGSMEARCPAACRAVPYSTVPYSYP